MYLRCLVRCNVASAGCAGNSLCNRTALACKVHGLMSLFNDLPQHATGIITLCAVWTLPLRQPDCPLDDVLQRAQWGESLWCTRGGWWKCGHACWVTWQGRVVDGACTELWRAYLIGRHQIFDAVVEPKVDHVERAVATDRRREASVEAAQTEAIGADDLPCHRPRGGRLFRTVRPHRI